MATSLGSTLGYKPAPLTEDLLVREIEHRCGNDLQLVVSLLGLQARRSDVAEVRQALGDVQERVAVLARARSAMNRQRQQSLDTALGQVCEALRTHAEPRGIDITLNVADPVEGLSTKKVTTVALVVNELATNAIKHAFEIGKSGYITIDVCRNVGRDVIVKVDDDGLPFPELEGKGDGLGLGLVKRLMASIDGLLILPTGPRKVFELRVPVDER